ncbi:hypothetical protein T492DRAFT_355769 [Pavlovales sp. CCMP2436]|nr:hypothetical protein T492DRAFT_355769 [Pavlovales sp. CCMP2436]
MPRGPLLALLLLGGAAECAGLGCSPTAPRPRVYVYDLPSEFRAPHNNWRGPTLLLGRLVASPYYERDGGCADFFVLPHFGGANADPRKTVRMFKHIALAWPWWNASLAEDEQLSVHMYFFNNFSLNASPLAAPVEGVGAWRMYFNG